MLFSHWAKSTDSIKAIVKVLTDRRWIIYLKSVQISQMVSTKLLLQKYCLKHWIEPNVTLLELFQILTKIIIKKYTMTFLSSKWTIVLCPFQHFFQTRGNLNWVLKNEFHLHQMPTICVWKHELFHMTFFFYQLIKQQKHKILFLLNYFLFQQHFFQARRHFNWKNELHLRHMPTICAEPEAPLDGSKLTKNWLEIKLTSA